MRFPPSASVRIPALPRHWAGSHLGSLALPNNCMWDTQMLLQGSAPPLSQPRQLSCPMSDSEMILFRASSTAALLVLCSDPADSLGVMQTPKIAEKPKDEIFNPFNFSALEPCTQKQNSAERSTGKQNHCQLSMSTDPLS